MSGTSPRHEAIRLLFEQHPQAALELLRAARLEIDEEASVVEVSTTLTPTLPDFRSDAIVRVDAASGGTLAIIIVEVQLAPDEDKRFTWPYYQARARVRYRVPCEVLVIAPDRATAKWAQRDVRLGRDSVFRPIVVGPRELTPALASRTPVLAFLCALANANRHPELVFAAVKALDALPPLEAGVYFDQILATLSEATLRIIKAHYMSDIRLPEFKSQFMRDLMHQVHEEGREEGREEARVEGLRSLRGAIRGVLEARGLMLTEKQLAVLDGCSDAQILHEWARRAAVAASADDVFIAPR